MSFETGAVVIVGVDAAGARDRNGRTLLERFQAGEFGQPERDDMPLHLLAEHFEVNHPHGLHAVLGGETGESDEGVRLIVGRIVAELSGHAPAPQRVPADALRQAREDAAHGLRALRALEAGAEPRVFLVWYRR